MEKNGFLGFILGIMGEPGVMGVVGKEKFHGVFNFPGLPGFPRLPNLPWIPSLPGLLSLPGLPNFRSLPGLGKSHIKAEMHNVTVLDNVFFAFYGEFAGFFYSCFASKVYVVVVFDDFCSDKAFFKVGVDYSGTLRCF